MFLLQIFLIEISDYSNENLSKNGIDEAACMPPSSIRDLFYSPVERQHLV